MTMQRLRLKATNHSFSRTWEGAILYGEHRPRSGGYSVRFPHPVGLPGFESLQWFYSYKQVEAMPQLAREDKDRYTLANGVWAKVVPTDHENDRGALDSCLGCAFEDKAECATAPPCSKFIRADNQDVIFITDIAKQITT